MSPDGVEQIQTTTLHVAGKSDDERCGTAGTVAGTARSQRDLQTHPREFSLTTRAELS